VVAVSSGALSGAWGGDADVVFNADLMRRQAGELEQARFTGQSRDGAVTALVVLPWEVAIVATRNRMILV
jgi:hypothetical protein